MELTQQDLLRLNVLLAQSVQAIRIDESRMKLYALSEKGEASIDLHADCKDEKYLKLVRQWLSTQVLGSPGGYPVYLKRWTRMGQGIGAASSDSLEKLLLLGEPEAIVAVVHAHNVSNEIARRAWWCSPTSDNARCLLRSPEVVNGSMGSELAEFLVEFLPFEESSRAIINSVYAILQPGLVDSDTRADVWKRAKRRNAFYLGFIRHGSVDLPEDKAAHPDYSYCQDLLQQHSSPVLEQLCMLFSPSGQTLLDIMGIVLRKPNDQDVAVELFNTMGEIFALEQPVPRNWRDIDELNNSVEKIITAVQFQDIIEIWPQAQRYIYAILYLSMLSETLLDPIFGVTDSIGSVMRKRIKHLTDPILDQLTAIT